MQIAEDKTLKPEQCHFAGCKCQTRASTKKAGKKAARGKRKFCRKHVHIGSELPRKTLRTLTATQVVQPA